MRHALPTWVGGAWGLAAIAMAVSQFVLAAPYRADALLAAAVITLITSGPMLFVAWGLASRRLPVAGTVGAALGIGVTGLAVVANSMALGTAPPGETLLAGAVGLALGLGAWLARIELVRERRPPATPHAGPVRG